MLVMLAVVAVVVALAFRVGGGNGSSSAPTSTTARPADTVSLTAGEVTADSAGAPVTVTPGQTAAILQVLDRYVTGATLQPLRTGRPTTADLGAVFDAGTLARVSGPDRGVALDDGLPDATGAISVSSQPVARVGLGDQSGALVLVSAALAVDVKATTAAKGGPLVISRKAQFVLAPDAAGAWKVTSYDMIVTRAGAGLSTTTTTHAVTTTTRKAS